MARENTAFQHCTKQNHRSIHRLKQMIRQLLTSHYPSAQVRTQLQAWSTYKQHSSTKKKKETANRKEFVFLFRREQNYERKLPFCKELVIEKEEEKHINNLIDLKTHKFHTYVINFICTQMDGNAAKFRYDKWCKWCQFNSAKSTTKATTHICKYVGVAAKWY